MPHRSIAQPRPAGPRAAAFALGLFLALAAGPALPARAEGGEGAAAEELYDLAMDAQYDATVDRAERALAADPRDLFAHKLRVFAWYSDPARDVGALLEEYRKAPASRLTTEVLLHGELLLAQRIPDGEARKAEYERLRDRTAALAAEHPADPELWSLHARAQLLLGAAREAGEAMDQAIGLDPGNLLYRTSQSANHLPPAGLERNRGWLGLYARTRPDSPYVRAILFEQGEHLDNEAERGLYFESLLPVVMGTRHEDDVRLRLAQLDRRADEHLEAIRARGFCNRSVEAALLAAERAYGREGVWAWLSAEDVRKRALRKAIAGLAASEREFRGVPGELLAARARYHLLAEQYAEARACIERMAAAGAREARHTADARFLAGDAWYAEGDYAAARTVYDEVLAGNAAFPFPARLRHLECMVRAYPLLALAQGEALFLLLLGVFLSVTLTAARLETARRYFRLAALPALAVSALELALYVRTSGAWGTGAAMVAIVGFLKNFFLLTAGMVLTARAGLRPCPALRGVAAALRGGVGSGWGGGLRAALPGVAASVGCWALLLGLTFALVSAIGPRVNEAIDVARPLDRGSDAGGGGGGRGADGAGGASAATALENDPWIQAGLLAVAAAMEELLFRHFLLSLFASFLRPRRWSAAFAITATALLWGVGHLGGVDPWWYRMVQTTACGLALGALCRRHGIEAAFLVHLAYNWTQMGIGRYFGGPA
ncbi:MAG: CPBP family intramembrane metalloprotease [Planctomycetes bacterium]|nr:CPBP family intramembrane metalloprotease [Planctomycetota bacterium]